MKSGVVAHENQPHDYQRRALQRSQLVFYLRVFNQQDNSVLGHVVDISDGGMMLLSDKPVPAEQQFLLRMRLPIELTDKAELQFEAISRWSKQDTNPDFHICGMQILNASPEVIDYIRHLIEEYGFENQQGG